MQRLDLQNLVLTWLDDLNGTYFTPAQVQVWLNNAQREVQKQLIQAGENWYVVCAETNTITNEDCYALPSDFLKCHKLEIITSGTGINENSVPLEPCTLNQANFVTIGPGVPCVYFLKKNCIVLRSVPDQAYVMRMQYSYIVSDMASDNSAPDVPTQYQEYIAVIATLDGLYRDGRDPAAFLEKRKEYLALMKQDAQSRRLDRPRMVVTTSDGGNWGGIY